MQDENGPVRVLNVGDVVWTAPGVKHWHGASPSTAFTHFAVSERKDGVAVEWLEPVSDDHYARRP